MTCQVAHSGSVEVALDVKDQTRAKVTEIVEAILRQNNAFECGIMARFSMTFAEGPGRMQEMAPSPELKKLGVVSLTSSAGG